MNDHYSLAYGDLDIYEHPKHGWKPRLPKLKDNARSGTIGQLMNWCYKNSIARGANQKARIYIIYGMWGLRYDYRPFLWSTSHNLYGIYTLEKHGVDSRQVRFFKYSNSVLFNEFNV
jgi:hypothetical protein